MQTLVLLYITTALMTAVAVFCSWLCIVWSVPSWRRRLSGNKTSFSTCFRNCGELTGWTSRIGSGLISVGIAVCASVAWYGVWSVLVAVIDAS